MVDEAAVDLADQPAPEIEPRRGGVSRLILRVFSR